MEITARIRPVLVALGLTAALAGCGGPSGGDPGGPGGDGTLVCERDGYACSLADVPEEVRDASWSALEAAYDALATGTIDDAVATLEARGARMRSGGTTYVVIASGVRADAAEALPTTGAWRLGRVDRAAG